MNWIAVLSGDLIRSTDARAQSSDDAMDELRQAALNIADWCGGPTRMTRNRGDGWQMVLPARPELALRAALYILARLRARPKGLGSRISVALGAAETLGHADLSDARGPAFTLSGRQLDRMSPHVLRLDYEGISPLHHGFIDLLEAMALRWTPEQAEAVGYLLPPPGRSQREIAQRLGISDAAISQRLRGAQERALQRALSGWETDQVKTALTHD